MSAEYANYVIAKVNFHMAHKEIDGAITLEKWIEAHRGADSAVLYASFTNNRRSMALSFFFQKTPSPFMLFSSLPADSPAPKPCLTSLPSSFLTCYPLFSFDTVTHLLDLQQSMLDWVSKILGDKELTDCRVSPLIPCIIESYNIYCMEVHILKMLAASGNNADVFSFLVERFRTQYNPLRKFYFTSSNIRYITSIIAVPVLAPEPPQFGAPRNVTKKPKSPRKEEVVEVEVPDFNPRGANAQQDAASLFNQQPPQPVAAAPSPFFNEWLAAQQAPAPVPIPVPVAVPAPEPQIIIKNVIPEDILRRLAELEKRVRELEAYNQQLIAENTQLKADNNSLRKRLAENEQKLAAAEAARRLLLEEQIAQAGNALKSSLAKFLDASDLGNSGADCEGLLDAIERLRRLFGVLVSSSKDNSSHTPQAGRDVSDITLTVLADAKGIASLLEDLGLKNGLLGASKNAADALAAFLISVQEIVGSAPNSQQLGMINKEDARIRALLDALEAAANATLASQRQAALNQRPGIDLEDIAEKELLAAAKMIEDAAAALEAQRSKRAPSSATGELNVEESIMAAAMAITAATQGLVRAAAEAQHERIVKGKVADPSQAKYHHDPTWIEGLISAARAVAEATRQLVGVANDAFQGKIDDAALIAASRAVGASTAQLVAATRSKSDDIFSKTQTNLDNAAAAVTRATQSLVRAAKNNQEQDFEAMALKRNENIAANIKAEIEQQARILRLEKELEGARRVLHGMNKSKYEDAGVAQQEQRQRRGTVSAAPGTMGGFSVDDSSNFAPSSSVYAGGSSSSGGTGFTPRNNGADSSSSSFTTPRSPRNVETFNTSVKELQNKVGAQISFRAPPTEDGPQRSPRGPVGPIAANPNPIEPKSDVPLVPISSTGTPPPPPARMPEPSAVPQPPPEIIRYTTNRMETTGPHAPPAAAPAATAPAAAPAASASPSFDANNPFL